MTNIINVIEVSKRVHGKDLLHGVSFQVFPGEKVGLVGSNGAGKTTLLRLLMGYIFPTNGKVFVHGADVHSSRVIALQKVGSIVETPAFYEYLSGYENLLQVARILGIPNERIDRVVNLVRLNKRIENKVSVYSLGMKQRLALAQALLSDPDLLVLDEPTNGLDPQGMALLRDVLQEYCSLPGKTLLLSSHALDEVQSLCDRVLFIEHGRIISEENRGDSKQDNTYSILLKDPDVWVSKLRDMGLIIMKVDAHSVEVFAQDMTDRGLIEKLIKHDIPFSGFNLVEKSLRQKYQEIVKHEEIF